MAKPGPVRPCVVTERDDALAVAARILRRHTQHDPDRDYLQPDPADLIRVIRYATEEDGNLPAPPEQVIVDDTLDQLRILNYLQRWVDEQTLDALQRARRHRVSWQTLANVLGLGSRQAAGQLRRRLADLLRPNTPARRRVVPGEEGLPEVKTSLADTAARPARRRPPRLEPIGPPRAPERPVRESNTAVMVRESVARLYAARHLLGDDLAEEVGYVHRTDIPLLTSNPAVAMNAARALAAELRGGKWPEEIREPLDNLLAVLRM